MRQILNPLDILNNKRLYPDHVQVLRARCYHVQARMMERFGIGIKMRDYIKLTEECGKSLARSLRLNENLRFKKSPNYALGKIINPKYVISCEFRGQRFRVLYDAYDRMVLTVFFCNDFKLHSAVKHTDIMVKIYEPEVSRG